MNRVKRHIFLLILPFLLIMIFVFFTLSRQTKREINSKLEKITISVGSTLKNLIEISGYHLLERQENDLKRFLINLQEKEPIVYIGLFRGEKLIYNFSRFKGYLPVKVYEKEIRIFESPKGKIFEVTKELKIKNNMIYRLYIGFDYDFLTTFEHTFHRNFITIVGLFSIIIIIMISLILYFDKKFFQKELELIKEKEEKERFKELSLLTSEIAHEIKNPLNSIYLSFNVLEKYLADEKEAYFYKDAIKEEIKRISDILQSYSLLSKEIRPVFQNLNISDFIDEFSFLQKEELKSKNIVLKMNSSENIVIKIDKNILKQILLNLIKNSIEANADLIEVKFSIEGKNLLVLIQDNGSGLDEKLKGNIFKPFISTKTKGTGLGLHISLKLVRSLKGDIILNSSEAGKTSFLITIPRQGE